MPLDSHPYTLVQCLCGTCQTAVFRTEYRVPAFPIYVPRYNNTVHHSPGGHFIYIPYIMTDSYKHDTETKEVIQALGRVE